MKKVKIKPSGHRFERLLSLLNLLHHSSGLKINQISQKLGVSTRTAFRDIRLLVKSGLPIRFDQGYKLESGNIFLPLKLSPADYLTLHWALNSSLIKENYHLATNANRVLSQIRPHLSVQLEEEVRSAKEAVKFDLKQTGLPAKEMLFFAPLQTAIAGSNSVRLEYDSIESGLSLRNVDPYGLVFRRHAWYLVGFDHKSGEYRIFRLSRIKKLALKSQKFVRDQNFSLEKLFQDSWEVFTGQPMTVKIKFTGKAAKVVASGKRHPSEKVLIQKDGTLYYTARVAGLEEVSHWILSFGSEAEVLEPSELRSKFAQITREMQEIYSGRYSLVAEKRETYRVKGFKK